MCVYTFFYVEFAQTWSSLRPRDEIFKGSEIHTPSSSPITPNSILLRFTEITRSRDLVRLGEIISDSGAISFSPFRFFISRNGNNSSPARAHDESSRTMRNFRRSVSVVNHRISSRTRPWLLSYFSVRHVPIYSSVLCRDRRDRLRTSLIYRRRRDDNTATMNMRGKRKGGEERKKERQ